MEKLFTSMLLLLLIISKASGQRDNLNGKILDLINNETDQYRNIYLPGPIFAGVNSAEITVYGKGGHGALPHTTIDPIVLSARIILDIQTIVSREKIYRSS